MSQQQYPAISREGDLFLWQTGKYADVRVTCRGQSMLLHRAILSRCSWFKSRFDTLWPACDGFYDVRLDQFSPSLLQVILSFIYSTEVHHEKLTPGPRFDYELLATLYDMGNHLTFETFKLALLHIGTAVLNQTIEAIANVHPSRKYITGQIDRILAGVKIAYSGIPEEQGALRGLFVHFFMEIYESVVRDQRFYDDVRSFPMFLVDLQEKINLKNDGVPTEPWIHFIPFNAAKLNFIPIHGPELHDVKLSLLRVHIT
ncbi:hypothetical protein PG995_005587 [Apiospora arundinis]